MDKRIIEATNARVNEADTRANTYIGITYIVFPMYILDRVKLIGTFLMHSS